MSDADGTDYPYDDAEESYRTLKFGSTSRAYGGPRVAYGIPTMREQEIVNTAKSNHQYLLDSLARSERALQEAEAEERIRLEKYGYDEWPIGTVITFDYTFGKGAFPNQRDKVYSYAILKSEAGWYSSGPRTPDARSWDGMITFWERGSVFNMKVVKGRRKFRPILPPHIQEEHGDYGVIS